MQRLVDIVTRGRNLPPETVAEDVIASMRRFCKTRLTDDLTLVVMGRAKGLPR